MVSDASVLNLTAEEYVFLAGLEGGKHLLGVENPFLGYLDEEIRARWQEITPILEEKGLLAQTEEKNFEVSTEASAVIETCLNPTVSFLINTRTPAGEENGQSIHVDVHQAVQQFLLPNGDYQLRRLAEIDELYEMLIELFQLENQPTASGEEFVLDEEESSDILGAMASGDSYSDSRRLVKYGVTEESGMGILEFLDNYQVTGTIIAAAWRGSSWETADLGFLVSQNGIWRVRPQEMHGQSCVRFMPISAEEAQEKIKRLLNRMLPIRL